VDETKGLSRRALCAGCAVWGGGIGAFFHRAAAEDLAEDEKAPQVGDRLVYLGTERNGQIIRAEDLPLGGPQVQAYPQSPGGVTRDGSRLNLLAVLRLDPASLGGETAQRAAGGAVAYSAVCTHQSCPVNAWSEEKKMMVCSCHGSTYDPRHGAVVVFGPAPRPLPALPLRLGAGGVLEVAGPFTDQVGGEQM
jgi:rieske iron-sulfur protein